MSSTGVNEEQPQQAANRANRGFAALSTHISLHKIDFALLCTRIGTVVFTILYLLPFLDVNPYTCYQRALMSNAATSALRLHQRLPNVRLTREFLAQLLLEDSCHYLFYSLIFLNAYPMTLVLLPVALFGLLHASSYLLTLLDIYGKRNFWGDKLLMNIVHNQQTNILRLVAFTEISLMFFTISMIFFGRMSLLIPFVYYRFITLRYASRRNPYTRQMFTELRLVIEHQVNKPGFPVAIRNLALKAIVFIGRLAPVTAPPTAQ